MLIVAQTGICKYSSADLAARAVQALAIVGAVGFERLTARSGRSADIREVLLRVKFRGSSYRLKARPR